MAVFGGADHIIDRVWQLTGLFEGMIKCGELLGCWKLAIDEQIADFFKRRLCCQIMDGIAAIAQLAF